MHPRTWIPSPVLLVVLMALLGGCGESEAGPLSGEDSSSKATALVLKESDLPVEVVRSEPLPEPCSPVDVLKEQDAKGAVTPLYVAPPKSVGEVIGITPSAKKAVAAMKQLHAPDRLECIGATMESFGQEEVGDVTMGKPEPIPEGEEGSRVRFVKVTAGWKSRSSTTIVSFRSGRCVASLLFLLKGEEPGTAFIDDLVGRAYGSLANADATCR